MYEHGKVAYLDYVNPDYFNKFLLDNALKMLGYVERMRYLYKVEKRRFNEASFWLVRDSDFMNVVKLLGRKRIVELWCLPVVDVLELPWDDKVGHDISVVDVETGEVLQEVKENGELDVVGQVQQTACYAVEVYDEYIQGDNSYVVDEVESASESGEMEVATDVDWSEYIDELNVDWSEHIAVVPDVVPPADETLETDVVPPFFEDLGGHPDAQNVEPNAVPPPVEETVDTPDAENVEPDVVSPAGGEYEFEEGMVEEFSDPDYDQPEDAAADDSEEDVFFKLTERLDIGVDGDENQDKAGGDDGTDYEDSDDLRSIHSDPEEGDSSTRNDLWFNPANDMQDPKFQIGKHLIQLRTCLFLQ